VALAGGGLGLGRGQLERNLLRLELLLIASLQQLRVIPPLLVKHSLIRDRPWLNLLGLEILIVAGFQQFRVIAALLVGLGLGPRGRGCGLCALEVLFVAGLEGFWVVVPLVVEELMGRLDPGLVPLCLFLYELGCVAGLQHFGVVSPLLVLLTGLFDRLCFNLFPHEFLVVACFQELRVIPPLHVFKDRLGHPHRPLLIRFGLVICIVAGFEQLTIVGPGLINILRLVPGNRLSGLLHHFISLAITSLQDLRIILPLPIKLTLIRQLPHANLRLLPNEFLVIAGLKELGVIVSGLVLLLDLGPALALVLFFYEFVGVGCL
jgi:hypothetical protein